ncbi:MAG: hypothetical protein Q4B79_04945 [Moraxella sp.]|nr:hypothetical protein [Moraxella sp.]MDO4450290.1 hypothetical protein [Moraxella sp.]
MSYFGAQKSVTVDDGDTMTSLWQDKLAPIGVELFRGYLIELIDNL